jgi:hypothetical protein
MNQRLSADPSYRPSPGFDVGPDGNVRRDPGSFMNRHPWLYPLLGLGAGAGAAALAGGLGGAAGAGGGYAAGAGPGLVEGAGIAGVGVDAVIPGVVSGAGAGGGILGTAAEASPYFAQGTGPGLVSGSGMTPSMTSSILGNARDVGGVLNGINSNRQHGREVEAMATQRQDANENSRYRNALGAADLNLDAGDRRAATSVRGDILANAQPLSLTGGVDMVGNTPVPRTTGGVSPALWSDNTRQLGRLLSQQALQGQQTNDGRAIEPQAPLTPLPRAGKFDSILGGASNIMSLMGAINYGRR